jgi:L-fuconate dehydratase
LQDRVVEFVDHLHEHFLVPTRIERGRYMLPDAAGYSIEIRQESLDEYAFPAGTYWASVANQA